MDLEFGEQQQVLQNTAREFFAAQCPRSRVRELEEDELGYDRGTWRRMAELDWLGLAYPESLGGAGGSLLDLYVIYLEMGRSLFPSPHLASSVIAGETLLRAGTQAQRERILPGLARGERILAPALTEPDGQYGPDAVQLAASKDGAEFRLEGDKILVPYVHEAGELLVAARTSPGQDGLTLFLVETGAPGVGVERLDNTAGYPLFAVRFDGVRVAADAVVGPVDRGWESLEPALDRASVLQCAEIVGAGEAVLEIAVKYSLDREQFGQPIGRFQAVQYLCSDIAIDVHLTSLLARQAAWRIDAGESHRREVSIAKAHASVAAQHVVRQAHEVEAGHGFMLENDLQLFTRRAKHWEFNLGDAVYHHDAIVSACED
ncbi:MAG: acyl-CoA/acyl-ACP dehydrogenase [Proteobacteria bacterium]|nr:acyl-CoA/acyl-ACP dehydrogenase [Pseudomonadota bacterium]